MLCWRDGYFLFQKIPTRLVARAKIENVMKLTAQMAKEETESYSNHPLNLRTVGHVAIYSGNRQCDMESKTI